jgi:hypothetical protein
MLRAYNLIERPLYNPITQLHTESVIGHFYIEQFAHNNNGFFRPHGIEQGRLDG